MGERADNLGRRLGEFLAGTTEMHRIGHEEDEMDRQHRSLFVAMTAPGEWFHGIGVALDILIAAFIFGIFFFHIHTTFDSLDVEQMARLKEED